ncbi:hypothetical protein JW890_03735 [candidate division WOR-3 bacterium]|nr:hypothetical protein [candidate division WOR-3 bacterium]
MGFELKAGENILADVGANLFRGIEGVGGRMKITDMRILFEAHPFNIQRMPVEIPVDQISLIRKIKTLGVIPNGILIQTKSGIKYKFVVWRREKLIKTVEELLKKNSQKKGG